jgi:hypothetical protein
MTQTILFANNAASTLAGAISNSATTANLAPGTGALFPTPVPGVSYFVMTFTDLATGLLNEIVHVTAISGDVVTIVRAQEGTAAQAWNAGDLANNRLTAGQMGTLIQGTIPPAVGGRLQYTDATHLTLAPVAGGQLWIQGVNYQIPASLEVTTSGLGANTLYYVYAYIAAGSMTLEAVVTAYSLDATTGIPQKNTDPSRTLVGVVFTDESTHFNDSSVKRNVASYFNRLSKNLSGASTAGAAVTSPTPSEIAIVARVEAVTWGNEATSVNGAGSTAFDASHSVPGTQAALSTNNGGSFAALGALITTTGTLNVATDQAYGGWNYVSTFAEGHNMFTPFGAETSSLGPFVAVVAIQGSVFN